jgi:hypothetical protein
MKNKLQNAAVALAILLTTLFTGCSHQYEVRDLPREVGDGSETYVVHQLVRVDLTTGTMCGIQDYVVNAGKFVEPCSEVK